MKGNCQSKRKVPIRNVFGSYSAAKEWKVCSEITEDMDQNENKGRSPFGLVHH